MELHLSVTRYEPPDAALLPLWLSPLAYNLSLGFRMMVINQPSPVKAEFARKHADVAPKPDYRVVGFISSGTYGKVYKAEGLNQKQGQLFAIKKFKPEREGENVHYAGISQSACREMSLCTELSHPHLVQLVEIMLANRNISMVFEFAEHDLLQIVQHHLTSGKQVNWRVIRSLLYQLLNGVLYLHRSWVLHRDLKPANIMVTASGVVKIGDLGLARLFRGPLKPLHDIDKVVVTIWYRAPELLLGARHYTPAIDLWAVGCIFAELLLLKPIFKGEEVKLENKKSAPFQTNQMQKIIDVLNKPNSSTWPDCTHHPEYASLQSLSLSKPWPGAEQGISRLSEWFHTTLSDSKQLKSIAQDSSLKESLFQGLQVLGGLLEYDPNKRLSAEDALGHALFEPERRKSTNNCFLDGDTLEKYPPRRIIIDDDDLKSAGLPGTKRGGYPDDRPAKRLKES